MVLLKREGWYVNHKRIERIWKREGLKVPAKQPRRKRLWLNDGSCARRRPEYKNHVRSYDFVMSRSHDCKFRDELLNCEIFDTLFEAKVLIERWRKEYNMVLAA